MTTPADGDAPGAVGLVTVTYSPGEALESLLDSIPTASARPVQVIIADNGSTDGSVERAATRPGVRLLHTGSNLGYGGAANAGVAVLDPGVRWLVVINPDVVLGPGSIDALLAAAARHPDAGAFGPLITTPDGVVYPSARHLPSIGAGAGHAIFGWWWPSNPWTRRYRQDRAEPEERVAGWLSGSCLLLRREAFAQVDGFDPAYFMYFEDVDLGDRLAEPAGRASTARPRGPSSGRSFHRARRPRWPTPTTAAPTGTCPVGIGALAGAAAAGAQGGTRRPGVPVQTVRQDGRGRLTARATGGRLTRMVEG